ncbi:ABC transporter permease [Acuticoccus mangrovi]|uniref:ABC transporter permease n=1 Tax=Acuticoccus mangrovi TaxID=2796142 RepID=A0A934IFA6_9HYPH|nr:ABC transporter permease [Acuticoccus mangrovi]MBJ3775579.1 ABC transporter permease [Acuticoccus mangrovi]
MKIRRFLTRRLTFIIPLLVGIVFFTFMLVRLGGQDPVEMLAGPTATQGQIDRIEQELGLDQPLLTQFGIYLMNVAQGDLGKSWISTRPVLDDILARLPVTLELLFLGIGLGALVGIPAGMRGAAHPNGWFDQIARAISLLGFSIPTYWLGLVLLFVFFYLLGWAPPGIGRISMMVIPPPTVTGSYLVDSIIAGDWEATRSALGHLVLPVVSIAIISAAPIIKQTRAIAVEIYSGDAVRYAKACGLPDRQVRKIVMRNATVPILTFVGTEITGLVGTASLIEFVFAWGGLGQYGLNAIVNGDFAAVQGYVLALALFSVVVFLVVDLLVVLLEPRNVDAT